MVYLKVLRSNHDKTRFLVERERIFISLQNMRSRMSLLRHPYWWWCNGNKRNNKIIKRSAKNVCEERKKEKQRTMLGRYKKITKFVRLHNHLTFNATTADDVRYVCVGQKVAAVNETFLRLYILKILAELHVDVRVVQKCRWWLCWW